MHTEFDIAAGTLLILSIILYILLQIERWLNRNRFHVEKPPLRDIVAACSPMIFAIFILANWNDLLFLREINMSFEDVVVHFQPYQPASRNLGWQVNQFVTYFRWTNLHFTNIVHLYLIFFIFYLILIRYNNIFDLFNQLIYNYIWFIFNLTRHYYIGPLSHFFKIRHLFWLEFDFTVFVIIFIGVCLFIIKNFFYFKEHKKILSRINLFFFCFNNVYWSFLCNYSIFFNFELHNCVQFFTYTF